VSDVTESTILALDTSVVVAGVSPWHVNHAEARRLLARVLVQAEKNTVVLPRPVLVEAYSVLTRLPKPQRLVPRQALELLQQTLKGRVQVAEVSSRESWDFLENLSRSGTTGGAAHDAVILDLACQAGATKIYTFNLRHFVPLAPPGIEILSP
jgi:predicted nucleic acid-binding protein